MRDPERSGCHRRTGSTAASGWPLTEPSGAKPSGRMLVPARLKPTPGLRSELPYHDPTPGLRGGIFPLEQMLRHPPHGGPGNLVWGRSGKDLPCDCVPLPDGIGRGRLSPLRVTRERGVSPIPISTSYRTQHHVEQAHLRGQDCDAEVPCRKRRSLRGSTAASCALPGRSHRGSTAVSLGNAWQEPPWLNCLIR